MNTKQVKMELASRTARRVDEDLKLLAELELDEIDKEDLRLTTLKVEEWMMRLNVQKAKH